MELKSLETTLSNMKKRFNCTFMELKFVRNIMNNR